MEPKDSQEMENHLNFMAIMFKFLSKPNLAVVHALEVDIITASQELKDQTLQLGMDTSQFVARVLATAHYQPFQTIPHIFVQAPMAVLFLQKWCALSKQQAAAISLHLIFQM